MKILSKTFSSDPPSENEIFNVAVKFSLEWGDNWLAPINERIRKKYDFITEPQAEDLNAKCKEIQSYAWDVCEKELDGELSIEEAEQKLKEKYPGLDKKNLGHLISQNMYYVRK